MKLRGGMTDIKSMKLYTNVERIYNELAELGKAESDPLSVSDLSAFDQLHYHGSTALDQALAIIGATPGQHWLEIGSGIGGPARYLAQQVNLTMTALELQADQNALATKLSERCGLASRINHRCGDFLTHDWTDQRFDVIVSWLALYHIPERSWLLESCHALLNPRGRFYTEDLCSLGEIGGEQRADLARDLFATTLPTKQDYREDLEGAGFEIECFEDMTDDWAAFTHQRLDQYRAERARHIRVHGEQTVDALDQFYSAVDFHFQSGKLGGLRWCVRRGEDKS